MFTSPLLINGSSCIVACVFISAIPAFRCHVTIPFPFVRKFFECNESDILTILSNILSIEMCHTHFKIEPSHCFWDIPKLLFQFSWHFNIFYGIITELHCWYVLSNFSSVSPQVLLFCGICSCLIICPLYFYLGRMFRNKNVNIIHKLEHFF
jgi:hypothetical protein